MNEKIKDFRDLNVWKKGMEIVEEVYKTTQTFPSYELYGLRTQMRRAAVSIPSNIAEGFARKHNKEYKQFYMSFWDLPPSLKHKLRYL